MVAKRAASAALRYINVMPDGNSTVDNIENVHERLLPCSAAHNLPVPKSIA
jgi:hypothetical protein